MNWAVSKKFDLRFLQFSMLSAPLVLGAYFFLEPMWPKQTELPLEFFLFFIFTGLFDAPHIFQTFIRTHWDSQSRSRQGLLSTASLFAAIGFTFICYYMAWSGPYILMLGLYGGWHILRQHQGFLGLYQSKEKPHFVHGLEKKFFYMCWLGFLCLETNSQVELFSWWPSLKIVSPLIRGLWLSSFFILVWLHYMNRNQLENSLPKLVFFYGTNIGYFVLSYLNLPYLVVVALATLPHTLQYQGWIGRYQSIRLPQLRVKAFYLACWAFGVLLVIGPSARLQGFENLEGNAFLSVMLFYNAFVLWHYFIDSKIWKFSQHKELGALVQ